MPTTDILTALNWRFATKVFDPSRIVSDEDLHTILESGRLAPSSFGIEPWKFIVVTNPEIRSKLRAAGYDQPKITDASHLIVLAARTDSEVLPQELIARTAETQGKTIEELDGLAQMVGGAVSSKSDAARDAWLTAQTYIPLGIMVTAASMLGIDNGPMEGFDPAQVGEILGLPAQNLKAVTMLALGYRGDDAYASVPKTRRAFEEVVEQID